LAVPFPSLVELAFAAVVELAAGVDLELDFAQIALF
jgi:hypothetical protein